MKNYYYLGPNNQPLGPVPGEELIARGVTRDSLVWCEDFTTWVNVSSVPELAPLFPVMPPPPPAPPVAPVQPAAPVPPVAPAQPTAPVAPAAAPAAKPAKEPFVSRPDSYMTLAILSTIFCCLPLGIIAIVSASKVDSLWAEGCKKEAVEKAESAKMWSILSMVSTLVLVIVYIAILGL